MLGDEGATTSRTQMYGEEARTEATTQQTKFIANNMPS